METMTVTNEKTLQQGLNDVVINKVQKMIDGKALEFRRQWNALSTRER
jgi:hypothetical protein